MAEVSARLARVERLLTAARILADEARTESRDLRERLLVTTGLSRENIALGLARCLETHPAPEQLERLIANTPEAPHAHVLLSGNVFVAALRAIAIGVASSAQVTVRASRRDPALAETLHRLCPELFALTTSLAPRPGDHFWSYGSDETLAQVRASLPRGVWFHPHGAGFGAVVIDPKRPFDAHDVALDVALFDQAGCLSPRIVCVLGDLRHARGVARALADALGTLAERLPPGPPSPEQRAEMRHQRDAAAYAFEVLDAGQGWVSVAPELVLPPAYRNLHVAPVANVAQALQPFARHLTGLGTNVELGRLFPGARQVPLGQLQRPPLDGPVDLRHGLEGELI
jgi:hypothetical protein